MGILTFWIHSSSSKLDPDLNDLDPELSNSIHSEFRKTDVHRTIEKWHIGDEEGKLPFFFTLHNSKFSAFPVELLTTWFQCYKTFGLRC
jgi:hypothetical protein